MQIDTLVQIMTNEFITIANDENSKTHKQIQSVFEDYKLNNQNAEYNYYPEVIKPEHLTIQYVDYSMNYGWIGQAADSVYNVERLTALIFIPAFDNVHKGQVLNTMCFKMTIEVYEEANMLSNENYRIDRKIIELEKIEI